MTSDPSRDSSVAGEFTELPVLVRERIWGFWKFTSVNVGVAIATWAFLTGGSIALFAGAKTAIAATVIGNLVGVVLVALSTCLPSAKYGLEQYTALRSVFGTNGVRVLIAVMLPVSLAGWNAILAIMFGRAVTNVLGAAFGTEFDPNGPVVIALSLLAVAMSWLVLSRGPVSLEWVNKLVAPVLSVLTVVMLVLLLGHHSLGELAAAQPLEAYADDQLNFAAAVELSFATGFSWWTMMGNLARLTTSQRNAFWPNIVGLFGATVVAGAVGTFAALVVGSEDPTVWMIPIGGVALGALALLFIAFANVTSMVSQTYAEGLALVRAAGSVVRRIPWPLFVALLFTPAAVMSFWPEVLYDQFFKFMAWVGLAMAPLTAVYITDFFVLRRRRLLVRELYEPDGVSVYSFWRGFNPAALVAVAAGSLTYYLLLDPVTFESAEAFRYLTASVPSLVVTAVLHAALTVLWVARAGKGGYGPPTGAAASVPAGPDAADTERPAAVR
ncbi:purine-cytosine permease family protein [Haloechinothrix aidingensis]|uniref:purine-cytosine permease family protein n=1 Tax=Haloechinothrix aidingensis TaxID=2752311 RepID=UPI001C60FB4C